VTTRAPEPTEEFLGAYTTGASEPSTGGQETMTQPAKTQRAKTEPAKTQPAKTLPADLIDLGSDTATRPTPEMRRFMAEAPVGDDMLGEDPTVNLLEEMTADLLGKEAAVFLSSGTMCNLIGIMIGARHGEEVILDRTAHPYIAEAGAAAAVGGVIFKLLDGVRGVYTPEQVRAAINPDDQHYPRSAMVSIENTCNAGGGKVWPLEQVRAVAAFAHGRGLRTHMDGARLLNAVVASGVPARDWAESMDTIGIDLSKGLGAPVGGVLAGTAADIRQARRYRKVLGGATRQAGIIAAGGVWALRHHVERLAEDHANARLLAEGLAAIPGVACDPREVETNIIFFDVTGTGRRGAELSAELLKQGVRVGGRGNSIRACTHLDTPRPAVERALEVIHDVVASRAVSA
jgi:threonine aldolase